MALGYQDMHLGTPTELVLDAGVPQGIQNPQGIGYLVESAAFYKASLPTADYLGQSIYVADATGAYVTGSLCFWNGTNWIDVTTGVAVA